MGNPELSLGANATLCRRIWGGGRGEGGTGESMLWPMLSSHAYVSSYKNLFFSGPPLARRADPLLPQTLLSFPLLLLCPTLNRSSLDPAHSLNSAPSSLGQHCLQCLPWTATSPQA